MRREGPYDNPAQFGARVLYSSSSPSHCCTPMRRTHHISRTDGFAIYLGRLCQTWTILWDRVSSRLRHCDFDHLISTTMKGRALSTKWAVREKVRQISRLSLITPDRTNGPVPPYSSKNDWNAETWNQSIMFVHSIWSMRVRCIPWEWMEGIDYHFVLHSPQLLHTVPVNRGHPAPPATSRLLPDHHSIRANRK